MLYVCVNECVGVCMHVCVLSSEVNVVKSYLSFYFYVGPED